MTLCLTVGLIVMILAGLPVGFSILIAGFTGYLINIGPVMAWVNSGIMPQKMTFSLINFLLLSIPFFILAAKLMNSYGITNRIFSFANATVGFLPGGLGHANVLASLLFSGMSGAAVSDAAGLGRIEIKAMTDNGYDKEFSLGITAASSTIGPIFPPSVPMVVFSAVSGVSVGKLFLGGVVPGLIMTLTLMGMVVIYSRKRNYKRFPKPTFKIFFTELKSALLPLLTPVILLSGIWSGIFTPTEAAAIAASYALLISIFVYREFDLGGLMGIFRDTAKETANIGFLIGAAAFYGWVLARSGVTSDLASWLTNVSSNPTIVLIVINVICLIVGCFLEAIAAILILGPVFMPIIVNLGIDPIHFGCIMVLNLLIGAFTPPFGIILFILQDIAELSFERALKGAAPFLLPIMLILISMIFFPAIVTWLPNTLM